MTQNILVVDDEPDLVQLYKIVLNMAGLIVVGTTSGNLALSKIKEQTPDLILLDVMMPDITGIEICQQIRTMPLVKQPIIFMYSADDSVNNKERCLQAGANRLISKQIPMDEVAHQIKSALPI
ncbi:MAG: PleD family two-component system response regulator [Anaerolineae bacterium]